MRIMRIVKRAISWGYMSPASGQLNDPSIIPSGGSAYLVLGFNVVLPKSPFYLLEYEVLLRTRAILKVRIKAGKYIFPGITRFKGRGSISE